MQTAQYDADGRASLVELYARFEELTTESGFEKILVFTFDQDLIGGLAAIPVFCYRTRQQGAALWVLAGIHGEEPAGPNAIAQNVASLGQLGQEMPLVVLPMLNPLGYWRNWRYFDNRGDGRVGHSVGDAMHYLPSITDPTCPRSAFPSSAAAAEVTRFVLQTTGSHPPLLVLDHHEDDELPGCYIYSQGARAARDEVAREVVRILAASGLPQARSGLTSFGETITDGVAADERGRPVKDGSIDELLAAEAIIAAGEAVTKPAARTALVIETPVVGVPLPLRIDAHAAILRHIKSLWRLAHQQSQTHS